MLADKEYVTGSGKSTSSSISSRRSSVGDDTDAEADADTEVVWFIAPEGMSRVPFSKTSQQAPVLTLRLPSPPRGRGSDSTPVQSPSFPRPAFFSPPRPPVVAAGATDSNGWGRGGYYTKKAFTEMQVLSALASPKKDAKPTPPALSAAQAHALMHARTLGLRHAQTQLPPRTPCNSPARSAAASPASASPLSSPHTSQRSAADSGESNGFGRGGYYTAKAAQELALMAQMARLRAAAAAAVAPGARGMGAGARAAGAEADCSPTPCNSPTRPLRSDTTDTAPVLPTPPSRVGLRLGAFAFSLSGKK